MIMKKQSNNQESYQGLGTRDLGLGKNGIPEYRNTGGPDTEQSAIRNPQSAIKQSGFTLMELMMSLGILVVGLSMIATAFPSAMLENKRSVADTSATMVSENAAAICRVRLSHNAIKGSVSGQISNVSWQIIPAERAYPIARPIGVHPKDWVEIPPNSGVYYPSSRYGWLLAARQPSGNDCNDYQLVIVPYRKFLPTDTIPTFTIVMINDLGDDTGNQVITGPKSIGSPVISMADGTFAYVVDSDGNLSGKITYGASGAAMIVGTDGQDSPAIGCYVVRTAVAP